jgi:metal-responsive CopG/Arc/MetJ family transcriptional regulator
MAKVVLSVRLDEEDVRKLDKAAAYLHLNRSDLVQGILRQFVQKAIDDQRAALIESASRQKDDPGEANGS